VELFEFRRIVKLIEMNFQPNRCATNKFARRKNFKSEICDESGGGVLSANIDESR
jgi:hypothetical protein